MPREFITFPDGDIVLQSADGVDFRVDSVILRRASPFFATMIALPQQGTSAHLPVMMTETAEVLDDIIRSIYPSGTTPTFKSAEHIVELFRALDKYEITNGPLAEALLSSFKTIQPPIRAWALALKVQNPKARETAVRSFMLNSGDGLDKSSPELEDVDAWRLMHLLQIKKTATLRAQSILDSLISSAFCSRHRSIDLVARARDSPLNTSILLETVLTGVVNGVGTPCTDCRSFHQSYYASNAQDSRNNSRRQIDELLERAVLAEIQGVELDKV